MSVNVSEAGPFEKLVAFSVSEAEIEAAKGKAARKLSQNLKIRGFRPGKAPRPIVEATVGAERLRAEAIDELLPDRVEAVLDELELEPAVNPSLESIDDGDDGIDVQVKVTLWPALSETPSHTGRTVEVGSAEISEAEIAEQIDRIRDQFASLEAADRPAELGDFVTVDISATRDGADVPEAHAAQLLYEIGSGGFIEGIDDQLLGAEPGTTREFDGVLPEGFGELTGNAVRFSIEVGDVRRKVLPDLTDDWVAEITEFASVTELEVNLEERMTDMKRRSLAAQFRERALGQLVDEVSIELPETIVRSEMDEVLHRFVHRLERQGITLDDYFEVADVGREEFVDDLRAQAEQSLRTRLLLEAVGREAGVEVSDEELAVAVEAIAVQSEKPDAVRKALRQAPQEKSLVGDILRNKALALIVEGATPVDESGNPVDLDVEEGGASADGDETVLVGSPVDGAESDSVEAEVVEAEVVEAEVVEAEVVAEMEPAAEVADGAEEE